MSSRADRTAARTAEAWINLDADQLRGSDTRPGARDAVIVARFAQSGRRHDGDATEGIEREQIGMTWLKRYGSERSNRLVNPSPA